MTKENQTLKAVCRGFDVGINEYGFFNIYGYFDFVDDGFIQQCPFMSVNHVYIIRLLKAFNKNRLQELEGLECYVEREYNGTLWIPVKVTSVDGGIPFDIKRWQEQTNRDAKIKDRATARKIKTLFGI